MRVSSLSRSLCTLALVAGLAPRPVRAEPRPLRLEDRAAWHQVGACLTREPGATEALVAWVAGRGEAGAEERRRAFLETLADSPHLPLYRRAAAGVGSAGALGLGSRSPARPVAGMLLLARPVYVQVDRLSLLGVTRHEELDWREFCQLALAALPRGRQDLEAALRTDHARLRAVLAGALGTGPDEFEVAARPRVDARPIGPS